MTKCVCVCVVCVCGVCVCVCVCMCVCVCLCGGGGSFTLIMRSTFFLELMFCEGCICMFFTLQLQLVLITY